MNEMRVVNLDMELTKMYLLMLTIANDINVNTKPIKKSLSVHKIYNVLLKARMENKLTNITLALGEADDNNKDFSYISVKSVNRVLTLYLYGDMRSVRYTSFHCTDSEYLIRMQSDVEYVVACIKRMSEDAEFTDLPVETLIHLAKLLGMSGQLVEIIEFMLNTHLLKED